MYVYYYSAKGKYNGCEITVYSGKDKTALKMATDWAKENGIDDSTIVLDRKSKLKCPSVIFGSDGDY